MQRELRQTHPVRRYGTDWTGAVWENRQFAGEKRENGVSAHFELSRPFTLTRTRVPSSSNTIRRSRYSYIQFRRKGYDWRSVQTAGGPKFAFGLRFRLLFVFSDLHCPHLRFFMLEYF